MTLPASTPPSVFSQAISAVSSTDGGIIRGRLDAWRTGPSDRWRQVAANIESETALALADFVVLLTDFASEIARGLESPEDCWVQVCRRRHQFKGPRFPSPVPTVIGRAAPIVGYAKTISDSPGIHLSPDQCVVLLREVAMAGAAVKPRDARILRRSLLGRYVLWATFCLASPGESPFEHIPRTTAAIRTALGLGECSETETLVLISYRTQGAHAFIELFRPTIGDAESYPWYRPHSVPTAPYGMTCPLTPNHAGLPAQPEVVHREVTGETLLFPLYLAV